MKGFEKLEPVTADDGKIEAYNPDRYIDDDEIFRARVHSLFNRFDKDKDHFITPEEFTMCALSLALSPVQRLIPVAV